MNRDDLTRWWGHFRTVNGITLRAIEAIPADKIEAKPVRDMRSPAELIVHMYGTMRGTAEGIAPGEITWSEERDEKASLARVRSHADLVRFARECWSAADRAVEALTEDQIRGIVKTPWGGATFPGFVCAQIIYDEHLHHRGQLYAYLRQFGVEPPFLWDFENNAPEFQPRTSPQPV